MACQQDLSALQYYYKTQSVKQRQNTKNKKVQQNINIKNKQTFNIND